MSREIWVLTQPLSRYRGSFTILTSTSASILWCRRTSDVHCSVNDEAYARLWFHYWNHYCCKWLSPWLTCSVSEAKGRLGVGNITRSSWWRLQMTSRVWNDRHAALEKSNKAGSRDDDQDAMRCKRVMIVTRSSRGLRPEFRRNRAGAIDAPEQRLWNSRYVDWDADTIIVTPTCDWINWKLRHQLHRVEVDSDVKRASRKTDQTMETTSLGYFQKTTWSDCGFDAALAV